MLFVHTRLPGALVVELDRKTDDRGFFARTFCEREFSEQGLPTRFPQCNLSRNGAKGTMRGMHFNAPPHEEAKLVRCVRGAIYDVIIDLRPGSPTLHEWIGVELSADNGKALFIPKGFAHGFLTLSANTDVFYHMDSFYEPGAARGLRHNDPFFRIKWPERIETLSPRDAEYPDYSPEKAPH